MGVFYGLLTAAGFGSADFFVTQASRKVGPLRSLYIIQIFGLLALFSVAILRRDTPPDLSWMWLRMAGFGVVHFGGMYLLYRAFTVGSLAICSPIAASYALVAGILAFIGGERLPGSALAGAIVIIAGVIVVSRGSSGGPTTLAGVPEALGAAVLLGLYFWGLDAVTQEMGWLWPVIINRAAMLVCAFAILVRIGQANPRPESGAGLFLFLGAVLDSGGQVALNLGLEHSYTTTTVALGSLYSAVAVLLAWFFLKERLARAQWAGIAAILAGVLLVSV